jgi:hypothetical protein
MLQVDDEYLQELRGLSAEDSLPGWAQQIEVATEDPETHGGGIQNNVRAFTGRQLKNHGGNLAMATILDGIVEKKPIYDEAKPALCAIIWGLCRKGDFLPVDETSDSIELDTVINLSKLTTTRLKIAEGDGVREILREGGFIDSDETIPDGIVRLQSANETLVNRLDSLIEDVEIVKRKDVQTAAVRGLLASFIEILEAKREQAVERREAVKSRDTEWEEVVANTTEAQTWYDDATDVWNRRFPALTQLDARLTLANQPFNWLSEAAEAAEQDLTQNIEDYDGAWWTHDGWDRFNDARTISPALDDILEEDWQSFQADSDIDAFIADLQASPWIKPLSEFGSNIRPAFETEYIRPLRRASSWYEDISEAVSTMLSGTTENDAEDFISATTTVADLEPLAVVAGSEVTDLREKFTELESIVGEKSPDDVTVIGVLPADREYIDSELERLVKEHDLSVERTDAGVMIQ